MLGEVYFIVSCTVVCFVCVFCLLAAAAAAAAATATADAAAAASGWTATTPDPSTCRRPAPRDLDPEGAGTPRKGKG